MAYFRRRIESGAGLVINEITSVHPTGSSVASQLAAYDDRYIPGLKKLVDIAHQRGSKIAAQLHHCGRESYDLLREGKAMAPSAIPSRVYRRVPREMTLDDIQEIIAAFGQAAVRLREAGYDALELHGAHGYLLHQFLSSTSNQRQDEYGGDMVRRARFVIEIIQRVRQEVGDDFPILLRISADEHVKDGYTVAEMQEIAPLFVEAGIDMLHVSLGTHGSPAGMTSAPIEYQPGFNMPSARIIKDVVDVPIIGVGRFVDPFLADECIARGDADLISFGRQHLADPDFLQNAIRGESDQTLICLACNQGCIEREMLEVKSIRCAINPETGQELIYPTKPAANSRQVWVIGAGPAGLTAAYEAARLGHSVTLFEKNSEPGGQVSLAARAPFKGAYGEWIKTLTNKAINAGVQLNLNTEVTSSMIIEQNPEAVILSTGAEEPCPTIPGIDLPHVHMASEVFNDQFPVNLDQALVIGGGLVGMEVADYLREKGCKNLTLVEERPKSPVTKAAAHGYMLHNRFKKAGYNLILNACVQSIQPDSVTVLVGDTEQVLAPIDQVVIATGTKPVNDLESLLDSRGITFVTVGDALMSRRIIEAVEEGALAAWNL
ncbi:MAG: FAD-dependent oxidoreductase [Syntrophomonadaceae bacterium]|nr:FAD-dependent oxidoreductase [Syntrophomonadaceae bacterium]